MEQEQLRKEACDIAYKKAGHNAYFENGFIAGAEWEAEREKPIPYQCCPVCNGLGKVLADGFTSSVYQTCKVCNGTMVIPMHIPTKNK